MTKRIIPFALLLLVLMVQCNVKDKAEKKETIPVAEEKKESKEDLIQRVFSLTEKQFTSLISKIDTVEPLLQPRSIENDGSIKLVNKKNWCSGFFPGSLWYVYEYTKNDKWKNEAIKFTEAIDSAQFVTNNHDVGFMVQNSFGHAYQITGNETYKQAVIDAAKSLSTRFRSKAGIIQSWDTDSWWIAHKHWDIPVIIDNMMNLNLMYKASKYSNDSTFAAIANSHADTTLVNQYRDDYSCFHVADYDHVTGKLLHKANYQGYADSSSWARGQGWGLYGYTEAYRETGNKTYLKHAIEIADYIMHCKKIPADKIPYWDYDAPEIPNAPRDASAAALTASALLELSAYAPEQKEAMIAYAEDVLRELSSSNYLAKEGENQGFILMHSVGNFHEHNETDTALNYADYYYLEALSRWSNLK